MELLGGLSYNSKSNTGLIRADGYGLNTLRDLDLLNNSPSNIFCLFIGSLYYLQFPFLSISLFHTTHASI